MKRLMMAATMGGALVCAIMGAHADDPVYITGAEYAIDGNTLTVTSGDGTLVVQTPSSVLHLKIMEGASLKLGIDSPFGANHVLHVFGTLDLNGKSFSALRIANSEGMTDANRTVYGRVINTSSTDAEVTLTSSTTSYYYGTFEESPGKIKIVSCLNRPFNITGVASNTGSLSLISMVGVNQFQVLDRANFVKFVFQPPVDGTKLMRLGEISMTYKGSPVKIANVTASSTASQSNPASNLSDNRANTYWQAGGTEEQTITLSTSDLAAVDGYRITPFDGTDGDTTYRPSGWDVYVKRVDLNGWILVDSKRNYQWYSRQKTSSSTNILFSAESRPGSPLAENTEISLGVNIASRFSCTDPVSFGALAGSGGISIEDGTFFAPGDLSCYTGVFTASTRSGAEYLRGTLALSSSAHAEQPVSITNAQNLAIANGGSEPVSVLLDDARADEHLFGSLRDGENGQLGLVKRGSGERVIETEDAAYTGPTVVHGGKLTVARKRTTASSVTARYIRITPTEAYGTYNASYPWGMNEFKLLNADGTAVSWPAGTATPTTISTAGFHSSDGAAKLIDGNTATRMLVKGDTTTGAGKSTYPPVTIDTGSSVTFSAYQWWSPHGNSADANRTPTKWKIEVSNDNVNWTTCAAEAWEWSAADDAGATAGWTGANSVGRGPFSPNGCAQSSGTAFNTLDPSLFASGTSRDTHRKLKAQYIRFTVFETYAPDADENSWGWQLSEISLMKDGERIEWPSATTASQTGSSVFAGNQANLCNNVLSGGDGSAGNSERCVIRGMPSYVVINAHEVLEFDAYSLTSTSPKNSQNFRLPRTWSLEVSFDGVTYYKVDTMRNYEPTEDVLTKNYQEMGPFPVAEKWPLLDMGAGDSLGDKSPVAIDAGATLKLATDYEKFGPLSGAGALELEWDAVGEINACEPATFSGSVTGRGTLAVCGDSVQTFDNATLSGVKTLELNGGAIAGTAEFDGNDVTIAFNGGATRATLSGVGTLTVTTNGTDTVKYALPDVSNIVTYTNTLFTATNIPAESQALLSAGEFVGASRKWAWKVSVTETSVVLSGNKRGTTMVIR